MHYRIDLASARPQLCEAILMRRMELGIAQNEVDRRLGVGVGWFCVRESGKKRIDAIDLLAIATALETTPQALYRKAGLMPQAKD